MAKREVSIEATVLPFEGRYRAFVELWDDSILESIQDTEGAAVADLGLKLRAAMDKAGMLPGAKLRGILKLPWEGA